jgi:hypothetical protein
LLFCGVADGVEWLTNGYLCRFITRGCRLSFRVSRTLAKPMLTAD